MPDSYGVSFTAVRRVAERMWDRPRSSTTFRTTNAVSRMRGTYCLSIRRPRVWVRKRRGKLTRTPGSLQPRAEPQLALPAIFTATRTPTRHVYQVRPLDPPDGPAPRHDRTLRGQPGPPGGQPRPEGDQLRGV